MTTKPPNDDYATALAYSMFTTGPLADIAATMTADTMEEYTGNLLGASSDLASLLLDYMRVAYDDALSPDASLLFGPVLDRHLAVVNWREIACRLIEVQRFDKAA